MINIPVSLFKKYPGKRVVLARGKVVAVASDAMVAMKEAKQKYPKEKLSIFAVPVRGYKNMVI